jgi:hypothetical protein
MLNEFSAALNESTAVVGDVVLVRLRRNLAAERGN